MQPKLSIDIFSANFLATIKLFFETYFSELIASNPAVLLTRLRALLRSWLNSWPQFCEIRGSYSSFRSSPFLFEASLRLTSSVFKQFQFEGLNFEPLFSLWSVRLNQISSLLVGFLHQTSPFNC